MTEAQGWWLIVELGIIAIAAVIYILASLAGRSRVP